MNSTIPADLLALKARFETWRANREYVREPIPDERVLSGIRIDLCFNVSLQRASLTLLKHRQAGALKRHEQSIHILAARMKVAR
jgi:hypothetical protein